MKNDKNISFEFSNENDEMQIFFSEATNKWHCVFNAKNMNSSKLFHPVKRFAEKMIVKHNLIAD